MVVHKPKTIVPLYLVHLLKNYTVFLECTHSYSPNNVIFMHST